MVHSTQKLRSLLLRYYNKANILIPQVRRSTASFFNRCFINRFNFLYSVLYADNSEGERDDHKFFVNPEFHSII